MGFFASVDGHITPAHEARISVLDNGFTFGDSVYETLRTYGGRPFHLDRHLARLRASAGILGIALPVDDGVFGTRLDALLAAAGNEESYIRIMATRGVGDISYHFDRVKGPTVVMVVKPYEPVSARLYAEGVPVIVSSVRRNHPRALDPAMKSGNLINNIQAAREAQAKGAFEPVMLNEAGQIAEGSTSNVFLVQAAALATPPLDAGILAGITRALVLELARGLGLTVREDVLRVPDLLAADEVFITSSLKELVPVRSIDGRPVPSPVPGPVTRRLLAAFREYAPRHSR